MLHVNATAQTCQIMSITPMVNKKTKTPANPADDSAGQILRTGDRGLVRFRFMQRAEYLKEGTKLIFREGRTKGLGTVKDVFPVKESVVVGPSGTITSDSVGKSHVRSPTKDGASKTAPSIAVNPTTRSHRRQSTGDAGKGLK